MSDKNKNYTIKKTELIGLLKYLIFNFLEFI